MYVVRFLWSTALGDTFYHSCPLLYGCVKMSSVLNIEEDMRSHFYTLLTGSETEN